MDFAHESFVAEKLLKDSYESVTVRFQVKDPKTKRYVKVQKKKKFFGRPAEVSCSRLSGDGFSGSNTTHC